MKVLISLLIFSLPFSIPNLWAQEGLVIEEGFFNEDEEANATDFENAEPLPETVQKQKKSEQSTQNEKSQLGRDNFNQDLGDSIDYDINDGNEFSDEGFEESFDERFGENSNEGVGTDSNDELFEGDFFEEDTNARRGRSESNSNFELNEELAPEQLEQRYESSKDRYIEHPNSKKGLYKITKKKEYLYRTKKSPQTHAASIKFGMYEPTQLVNPDTKVGVTEIYDSTEAPMVLIDYEWQLWTGALGKMALGLGGGLYVANGNGQFESDINEGLTPREVFTLIVIPVSLNAVYRFQYFDNQILVPYGGGGGTLFNFSEIRDDDEGPKFGASFAANFFGGAAINLGFLDENSILNLDREYGINGVYLTAELRQFVGLGNYDFTGTVINAGFTVEY